LAVAAAAAVLDEEASRRRLFEESEVADGAAALDDATGWTTRSAEPIRADWPSNVTSAFSDTHDRLAELKRARITVLKRGMEKFDWAAAMRRGMESPRVTFVYVGSVEIVVVAQPDAPDTEQVEPVKPLMHIQEQLPVESEDVPPFWHAVEEFCEQAWRAVTVLADVVWGL
jgi:hypothetical protein